MSIKRKIEIFIFLCFFLCLGIKPHYAFAQKEIGGNMRSDIILTYNESPYIVSQNLVIDTSQTITIEAGVVIYFAFQTEIICNGKIIANGSKTRPISFISQHPYTGYNLWKGIQLNNVTNYYENGVYQSGSILNNLIIKNAIQGIKLSNESSLYIDSVSISECTYGLFLEESSDNTIANSKIDDCKYGVFLASSFNHHNIYITNNTFSNITDVGVFNNSFAFQSKRITLSNNNFLNCYSGANIGNYGLKGVGNHNINNNSFSNCHSAIKVFHDSVNVNNNKIVKSSVGIEFNNSSDIKFTNNIISFSEQAAKLTGDCYNVLINNSGFYYNNQAVFVEQNRNTQIDYKNRIIQNTFYKNVPFGSIYIEIGNFFDSICYNNIAINENHYSFINYTDTDFQAINNFWGVKNPSEIDLILYDFYDESLFGKIIYQPYYESEVITAPIIPPSNVKKQWQNNKMKVSFSKSLATDISKYKAYWGKNNLINFENSIDLNTDTIFYITNISKYDTIAVTCLDSDFDGVNDQLDGNESYFSFAVSFPYAGIDTSICAASGQFSLDNANIIKYDSLNWESSGTGNFNNNKIENPIYYFDQQDIESGFVFLKVTAFNNNDIFSDSIKLTLVPISIIHLPTDTLAADNYPFQLNTVSATNFTSVKWTTNGDGNFDNDTILNPYYTAGSNEIQQGFAELKCIIITVCDTIYKEIKVNLKSAFSISGKIHLPEAYQNEGKIAVFRNENNIFKKVRSNISYSADGNFVINDVFVGKYLICSNPEMLSNELYYPLYYFDKISWADAELIDVNTNIFDVDLYFGKIKSNLPIGIGEIKGNVEIYADTVFDNSFTIFLTDTTRNYIFKHISSTNKNFAFNSLPFGSYRLRLEMLNFPTVYSDVININPNNFIVDSISLQIEKNKTKFYLPKKSTNNNKNNLFVFPNPFNDVINIYQQNNYQEFIIYNANGQFVKHGKLAEFSNILNLSNIEKGVYFLKLISTANESQIIKIIKK